jgi:sporulation protein YlmC with PRC-barrel domain
MNNFRNTVAMLALLCASGVAYAQESTPAAPAPAPVPEVQNKADCPPAGTVPEADLSAECKAAGTAAQAPATSTDPVTTGTTTPAQDSTAATPAPAPSTDSATTTVGSTQVNPADAVLASQFMGQAVYTAANENIGEINDLIMNKELDTIVAVVGVGGFLGIGEKDVAIPINDIKVIKDTDNALRLTITASKEQLEALPAFDRTAMK